MDINKAREHFEKWVETTWVFPNTHRDKRGNYINTEVDSAWAAWQQALLHAIPLLPISEQENKKC